MSFPRYPKYKDSGVEWLGEVPEGWDVKRLKHLAKNRVRNGIGAAADTDTEGFPRYVRITDIDTARTLHSDTFRSLPPDVAAEAPFAVGDILFACVGATFGKSYLHAVDIGPVCYAGYLAKYSPNRLADPVFVSYWTESNAYWGQLNANVIQSTVQNFSAAKYNELLLAVPPVEEQAAIANFLDRETAKIDALIAEQQRLIELLQEKRQAVISRAVTKGLNPDAPMKDSGIEWLGEVPEHWTLKRLKHVSPYLTVGIVVNPSTYVNDDGLPFIYGGDIREGVIDWENSRRISQASSDLQAKTKLRCGDLLMVRVGAPGVTAVVPPECDGGNCASVMLIRQGDFSSQWLCYLLNTRVVRFQVEVVQYGAAQEQFNISHAVNFWLPVPPRKEQDEIAEATRAAVRQTDDLVAEANSAIALLRERRSALISAAVTGQIDVRDLATLGAA